MPNYNHYKCRLIPCDCPRSVSTTAQPPTTAIILSTTTERTTSTTMPSTTTERTTSTTMPSTTTEYPTTTTIPSTPEGKDHCWCLPQHCSPDMYYSNLCPLIPCKCPRPVSTTTQHLPATATPSITAQRPTTTTKTPTTEGKNQCLCLPQHCSPDMYYRHLCPLIPCECPQPVSTITQPPTINTKLQTTTEYSTTTTKPPPTMERQTTTTMPSTPKGKDHCWCLPQHCSPDMYYSYLCPLIPCKCPRPVSTTTQHPPTTAKPPITTQRPTTTTKTPTTEGNDQCWCLPQHCSPDMHYRHLCPLIPCGCPQPPTITTKPPTTTESPTTTTKPPPTMERQTTTTMPSTPEGNDHCWCLPQHCSPDMYYSYLCPLIPCKCPRPISTTTKHPPATATPPITTQRPTTTTKTPTTEGNDQCWCLPQHCSPDMYYRHLCPLIPCGCPQPPTITTKPPTTTESPTTTTKPPPTMDRQTTTTTMPSTPEGNDLCWCLPQHCSPDMHYRHLCPLIPCGCPQPPTITTKPPTTTESPTTTTKPPPTMERQTTTTMPSTTKGKYHCWCLPQHCSPDTYYSYLCPLIPCKCPRPVSTTTKHPPATATPPITTQRPTTTTKTPTTEGNDRCWCLPQHCSPNMHYRHLCPLIPCGCPQPPTITTKPPTTTESPTTTTKPPPTMERQTITTMPSTTKGNDHCWCLPQHCSPDMYYSYLCPLIPCKCPRPVSTTTKHPPATATPPITTQRPTTTTKTPTTEGNDQCWCLPQHCSPDMHYRHLCPLIPCGCPQPPTITTKPPTTTESPTTTTKPPPTMERQTTTTMPSTPEGKYHCWCLPQHCSPDMYYSYLCPVIPCKCPRPVSTTTQHPPTTAKPPITTQQPTTTTKTPTTEGKDQCWCLPQHCSPDMYYRHLCPLIPCGCPQPPTITTKLSTTTESPTTTTKTPPTMERETTTTMPSTPKGPVSTTTQHPPTAATTPITTQQPTTTTKIPTTEAPTGPIVPWYGFLLIALAVSIIVPALLCIYGLIMKSIKCSGVAYFTQPSNTWESFRRMWTRSDPTTIGTTREVVIEIS
ncbi:uncharacterized protein LOC143806081 [Ranitomeya variabilis]|uniref:uncharacterized protein LOC143806081 n=1 Tax=Ranitomeya variabilis TaxID=490064 RepID=UPI004057C596